MLLWAPSRPGAAALPRLLQIAQEACSVGVAPARGETGPKWLWVNNRYLKWVALVNGSMDENLRSFSGLILTHTQMDGCAFGFPGEQHPKKGINKDADVAPKTSFKPEHHKFQRLNARTKDRG